MTSDRRHFATQEEFDAYCAELWKRYTYRFGDWSFNWATRVVQSGTDLQQLTEREADVLRVLCESTPVPLSGARVAAGVRALNGEIWREDNAKVYVRRLRRKLGQYRIIHQSAGYVFNSFGSEGGRDV